MRKFLRIEVIRCDNPISIAHHLITDNVSSLIHDQNTDETRIYFKDANPFTFIRVFLTSSEILSLFWGDKASFALTKEGSQFIYSMVSF